MRQATLRSRCECQAQLVATINESHLVVSAFAIDRSGEMEAAPAHTMGPKDERFDVGWLCSVCGRNVMRSFSADAIGWFEVATPPVLKPRTRADARECRRSRERVLRRRSIDATTGRGVAPSGRRPRAPFARAGRRTASTAPRRARP
jgi:hypothetical protein